MNVFVLSRQKDLIVENEKVSELVIAILNNENCFCDEVTIHLVDEKEICALHAEFFDDPSLTDCISFPMDQKKQTAEEYQLLGEVFVCPAVALAYVKENGGCAYEELSLYIIHGLLHLLGYDDIDEEEEKMMRKAEDRLIKAMKHQKLLLP